MTRMINKVVVHCSDSPFGDANVIRGWHQERGFRDIGYHIVICNGFFRNTRNFAEHGDGMVQVGRPEEEEGAHVYGHNENSLGVCLIGVDEFTAKQFETLENLIKAWIKKYNLQTLDQVVGHYQLDPRKTCPNFDVRKWANSFLSKNPPPPKKVEKTSTKSSKKKPKAKK